MFTSSGSVQKINKVLSSHYVNMIYCRLGCTYERTSKLVSQLGYGVQMMKTMSEEYLLELIPK